MRANTRALATLSVDCRVSGRALRTCSTVGQPLNYCAAMSRVDGIA
jgi:hypothetical protein